MDITLFLQDATQIHTLTEQQCVDVISPYVRKQNLSPELKSTIAAIRKHHQTLHKLNPIRITTDPFFLDLFATFADNPRIVDHMSISELDSVYGLLKGKTTISPHLIRFKTLCKDRLDGIQLYSSRHERAKTDSKKLHTQLGYMFDVTEDAWKRLRRLLIDQKHDELKSRVRHMGRMAGLMINDLPIIHTNLYSLDALRNIIKSGTTDNKTSNITDEHFESLYANKGPELILSALQKSISSWRLWEIDDHALAVFNANQTIKTTKAENNRLSSYHRTHKMVNPQHSYDQANVSPLIKCPKNMQSSVVLKWKYLFDTLDLDFDNTPIAHPFDRVLTLDDAIIQYPELIAIKDIIR